MGFWRCTSSLRFELSSDGGKLAFEAVVNFALGILDQTLGVVSDEYFPRGARGGKVAPYGP